MPAAELVAGMERERASERATLRELARGHRESVTEVLREEGQIVGLDRDRQELEPSACRPRRGS